MSSQLGTLLDGRYRLDAQIGTGGMSTVYRAFDTTLERQVAIKLMHRDIATQSDQLERFRREARAVAQLNHQHVVGVIDAGEAGEETDPQATPYIVFEYVQGETLKERIRRQGRLPVPEAVAYAIEIARALGAAHERGIVHRDVKPQNVLVDGEGLAKVTDFGIARTLEQEGLTADGRVLGTTDYVSPEQALGHAVTGQSDLYSLGIVLFEMLTGDVPFTGENQVAVAMKHVREEIPDVQARRPEVSSALARVIDIATAKDLTTRYATAEAMIADLEEVLAVEASRAGETHGQATAVIQTLPSQTKGRIPSRVLHPKRIFALLAIAAVVAGVLVVLARDNATKGTGKTPNVEPAPGLRNVSLKQGSAHDFDPPPGDGKEHDGDARLAVDRDPGTAWSTETYRDGLEGVGKTGVGLYVDAPPPVAARKIIVQTPTPGWTATVYAAKTLPSGAPPNGWIDLGELTAAKTKNELTLDTGAERYRYYLVWITKLPTGKQSAEISEISLQRDK
ncbi:MAG TPA: protein kinase [Solirubrobacteraceae bacterium]